MSEARDLGLAFGVAAVGGALFWALGVPAPMLTGAAACVSLAGLLGLRAALPIWLRNLFFLVLGLNIGTGVTPQVVASLPSWWISVLVLGGSMVLTLAGGRALLVRGFGYDRATAALASAPGHLSFVLGLGADSGADVAKIALIQSIRVLILTLAVPPLIAGTFGATGLEVLPSEIVSWPHGVGLGIGAGALGWLFLRLRLPAALLLAGMAVSAVGHGSGLTPGRVPDAMTSLAFLGMGVLIGSRFSGVAWADLRAAALAGLAITLLALGSAGAAVLAVLWLQGVSPALLIVAFAPGGVEAMSAIGIALGLDPAFVAGHHVARLLMLTALIPLFARRG